MEQIAAHFNISKTLVSFALSDKYGVSEEMRSKIRLYALENGYDFSKCKSSKKTKRSVMFLISSTQMFKDTFWSKIIAGVENELTQQKINLEILSCQNMFFADGVTIDLNAICHKIAASKPNGIIIISQLATHEICSTLKKLNIPIVLIDQTNYMASDLDQILIDNYHGGYHAAEYLASMGHKNLCFLGDIRYADSFRQRFNGFRDYCETKENLSVKYLTGRFDDNEIFCYNKTDLISFLRNMKEHPAIMCANDPIAFQVYKVCDSLGLRVGKDVSILGFDDIEPCVIASPPLSSIHVHRYALGKTAVETLINRMNGETKPYEIIQLSTYLCERESVADLTEK